MLVILLRKMLKENVFAHNDNINSSFKFLIQIFLNTAPPRVHSEPDNQLVPEGEPHKVRVSFSGDGPFRVKLFKDGKELPVSTHF